MVDLVARTTCPACRCPSRAAPIYSIPYVGSNLWRAMQAHYPAALGALEAALEHATYELLRCECGLVYQRWVPNEAMLQIVYRDLYPTSSPPDCVDPPHATRDGQELLAVARFLGRPVSELKVYDFGMGWGLWASIAARLGCRSYGFEYAPDKNAHARARGVTILEASEIAGLDFDFINLDQVMEHVLDPVDTLSRLVPGLAPGGIIKISIPKADDIEDRLRIGDWTRKAHSAGTLIPVWPLEHVNLFDARSLTALAAKVALASQPLPLRPFYSFVREAFSARPTFGGAAVMAKGLIRPLYHRFSRHNRYAWFRRRGISGAQPLAQTRT